MSGRYPIEAVSATNIGVLLSSLARARARGRLRWSSKKPSTTQGVLDVCTALTECPTGVLRS